MGNRYGSQYVKMDDLQVGDIVNCRVGLPGDTDLYIPNIEVKIVAFKKRFGHAFVFETTYDDKVIMGTGCPNGRYSPKGFTPADVPYRSIHIAIIGSHPIHTRADAMQALGV